MKLDFDISAIEKECMPELWRVCKHRLDSYLEGMEWQANMTGTMFYYERGGANTQEELDKRYNEILENVPLWQVGYLEHLYNAPNDEFWLFEEELRRVGEDRAKFLIVDWLREIERLNIEGYNFSEDWLKERLGDEIWGKIGGNIKFHLDLMDKLSSARAFAFENEMKSYKEELSTREYIKGYMDALTDSSFEYDQGYVAHVISDVMDGKPLYTFRDYLNSIDGAGIIYIIKEYLKEFNIYG